jgi:Ca2+-binding RTX toxin-like protein
LYYKKYVGYSILVILLIIPTMFFSIATSPNFAEAGNIDDDELKDLGVTDIEELGERIDGIEIPSGIVRFGNIQTCPALVTCTGTNGDDVIYAGAMERVLALDGDDIVYGGVSNQIYGGKNDDLLMAGAGKVYVDGGPGSDILIAGLGNALLTGGDGNDKLFAGPASSVMYGGKGANNFDCPLSVLGLARSVVMDYNPTNGDTLSGPCKIINTVGNGNSEGTLGVLPDTQDSEGSSTSIVPGLVS